MERSGRRRRAGLDEVPGVAVEVVEDGDHAEGFVAWLFDEVDSGGEEAGVVACEVVRVEEEEDATSALASDGGDLGVAGGPSEEEAGVTHVGPGWGDDDPAFAVGERRVLEEFEAEPGGEPVDGFVVVADEEGELGEAEHVRVSGEAGGKAPPGTAPVRVEGPWRADGRVWGAMLMGRMTRPAEQAAVVTGRGAGRPGGMSGATRTWLMRVVNLGLLLAGGILAGSGWLLAERLPRGPGSSRVTLAGLGRHDWAEVHAWVAWVSVALVIAHLALNWRWVTVVASSRHAWRVVAGVGVPVVVVLVFVLAPLG